LKSATYEHVQTDIQGIFVRFDPHISASEVFEQSSPEELFVLSERRTGLQHWLSLVRQPVINRPWAGRENAAKPFQMQQLADAGMEVPRWVVTNESTRAQSFLSSCTNGAVVKSCSGLRPKVKMAGEWIIERLQSGSSPVILQEYVSGREVRVHVVGERSFPAEVNSRDVDYRFSEEPTGYALTSLPSQIGHACVRDAQRAGLTLAGFDFRVSNEDKWFCLEMNPVPSFLPYELATGLPIAKAVLRELGRG